MIAGLSAELAEKLGVDLMFPQFQRELPAGCELIPYDVLRDTFSDGVPPQVMILVPWVEKAGFIELLELVEAEVFWWPRFTLTEVSVEFWRQIEERAMSFLPTAPRLIAREDFEIAEGSFRYGELVPRGPYARHFAERILPLRPRQGQL